MASSSLSRRRVVEREAGSKVAASLAPEEQQSWNPPGRPPGGQGAMQELSMSTGDSGIELAGHTAEVEETPLSSSDGIFSAVSPVTLGAACACALLIVIAVMMMLLWLRTRRRRQKLLHDLTFDECVDASKSSKSAPTSRSPSPKQDKRITWPDNVSIKKAARGVLVRSLTADRIPEFTLPPERVQPRSWSVEEGKGDFGQQVSPQTQQQQQQQQQYTYSSLQQRGNLGNIQPDLYSIQTSPSEDDELSTAESAHGRLWYSLLYHPGPDQLIVTLIKVKDLPGRGNTNNPRDPFVKMYLLPDERTCRVSKVKKKTLNPIYNETVSFVVSKDDISQRVLRFSVYDVDKRRVRHSLGHVMVSLKSADLTKNDVMWADLESTVQPISSLGNLQISLLYQSHSDKIKVGLHRARNLSRMAEYQGNMGAYIRIQLFYGHKCHRVKRTLAVSAGSEVTFNESLSFSVHGRQLDSCNIAISLMLGFPCLAKSYNSGGDVVGVHSLSRDGGSGTTRGPSTGSGSGLGVHGGGVTGEADVEYGRVVLGPFMYARGDELAHWQDMVTQPKAVTTRWHAFTSAATPTSSP